MPTCWRSPGISPASTFPIRRRSRPRPLRRCCSAVRHWRATVTRRARCRPVFPVMAMRSPACGPTCLACWACRATTSTSSSAPGKPGSARPMPPTAWRNWCAACRTTNSRRSPRGWRPSRYRPIRVPCVGRQSERQGRRQSPAEVRLSWGAVHLSICKMLLLAAGSVLAVLVGLVWWLGVYDPVNLDGAILPAAPAPQQIARAAYLARAGNCMACHTRRGDAPYTGGRPIETPFGTVYAGNFTPDVQTSIGSWSAAHFWRALHHGRSRDGRLLLPVFPYTELHPGDPRGLGRTVRLPAEPACRHPVRARPCAALALRQSVGAGRLARVVFPARGI